MVGQLCHHLFHPYQQTDGTWECWPRQEKNRPLPTEIIVTAGYCICISNLQSPMVSLYFLQAHWPKLNSNVMVLTD